MRRIGILLSLALLACTENLTPYPVEGDGEVFDCLPNLDGVIESSEFPTLLDTPQDLLIASGVQLDLGGDALELRQELPGETKTPLVAESVAGYWFADEVSPEAIVFPLDGASENLAILHRGAQSVELLKASAFAMFDYLDSLKP